MTTRERPCGSAAIALLCPSLAACHRDGDIPNRAQGRPRRRRGACFRGGLLATAAVGAAAPGDRSQTRGAVLREGGALPRLSESRSRWPRWSPRNGGSFPDRQVAPRRPPASLLRVAEQAPATVESALMQLVQLGSQVDDRAGYWLPTGSMRGGLRRRAGG